MKVKYQLVTCNQLVTTSGLSYKYMYGCGIDQGDTLIQTQLPVEWVQKKYLGEILYLALFNRLFYFKCNKQWFSDTPGSPNPMLGRCFGLHSPRNSKINIVCSEGGIMFPRCLKIQCTVL